jgi:undecaprenyl-diphosphatase
MLELLQTIDESIVVAVNSWNSPFLDSFMWWVSGKFTWWPFYAALLVFIFWQKKWKEGGVILLFTLLLITLSDQSSVHLFKEVIRRPRPSHNPEIGGILHYVNEYKGGLYGFISSHASNAFAVAAFLAMIFKKSWFSLVIFLWAILVSYSRIYLGVHYLSDILAGAAWGVLLAYIFNRAFLFIRRALKLS